MSFESQSSAFRTGFSLGGSIGFLQTLFFDFEDGSLIGLAGSVCAVFVAAFEAARTFSLGHLKLYGLSDCVHLKLHGVGKTRILLT